MSALASRSSRLAWRRDAGPGVGLGDPPLLDQPGDGDLGVDVDHDQRRPGRRGPTRPAAARRGPPRGRSRPRPPARRAISAPTAGWTMALRSLSASGSVNTMSATAWRSSCPSASEDAGAEPLDHGGEHRVAGRPAPRGRWRRRRSRPRPSSARRAETVDLPEPMPPVRPMSDHARTVGNLQTGRQRAEVPLVATRPPVSSCAHGGACLPGARAVFADPTTAAFGRTGRSTIEANGRSRRDQVAAVPPGHPRHPRGHHRRLRGPVGQRRQRHRPRTVVLWCAVLVAYTVFRTVHPLRYTTTRRSLLRVLGEVGVPRPRGRGHRLLGLAARLLAAHRGHGGRVRPRVRLRGCASRAVAARGRQHPVRAREPAPSSTTSARPPSGRCELLLVALVAGYARRISGEADRQHIARPRPPRPPRRRQRPAVLAPPGHPDPAGVARPRRGARHHDAAGSGTCSTSTPSPSCCSTTPTAAGTSSAARAPARRPRIDHDELPPPLARALRLRQPR